MERRTLVFVVCSPLPRVGKTLLARLLMEFFLADGRPVAAFDLNPDDCALAEQRPDHTTIAHVEDTKAQMALFDRLVVADEVTKVVDLGDRCFDRFFAVMADIGFASEAPRRGVVPVMLFIADADRRSLQAYAALQARFPGLTIAPVLNAGASDARFRNELRARFAVTPLQIPFLSPAAKALAAQFGYSPGIGGGRSAHAANELQAWKRKLFLQFREFELRLLLEELKPALQLRA
ncbi:MAG TPA: hypothetical protein VNK48_06735 [Xanthobacteraceae bacterium]|nr:hypothetical protein [Xanthobacteraceae bacterium]